MPNIKTISPEEAKGRLKDIYDDLMQKRGNIAEVHKIQSLRPESIVKHMDLYMEIMYSKSELSRAQREMMAVVTSKTNNCNYCIEHHASALQQYWKDEKKVEHLKKNYSGVEMTSKDMALCVFSEKLTKNETKDYNKSITKLKEQKFSDEAILDASLVVSYFNFVNRMVLSLGVALENDKGENYKY